MVELDTLISLVKGTGRLDTDAADAADGASVRSVVGFAERYTLRSTLFFEN